MDISKAIDLAYKLINKYDLQGWKVKLSNAKRLLGLCSYSKKTIFLSKHYIQHNVEDIVKDTIKHEIAHAITGPGVGHGPKWKKIAVQIGANPNRCKSEEMLVMPPAKYTLYCKTCGFSCYRYRKPKYKANTYICPKCPLDKSQVVLLTKEKNNGF